jgi:hypothetical protein
LSFNSAPSTQANQLPLAITFPEEDKEFREALTLLLKRFATTINTKEGGLYTLTELVNNEQYFTPGNTQAFRLVYRTTVNFGALPNAGVKSVPHNIAFTSTYSATHIYGAASDTTGLNYIPLPYASPTLANNIELDITSTNVVITTGANRSNYNLSYIVIEYVKN